MVVVIKYQTHSKNVVWNGKYIGQMQNGLFVSFTVKIKSLI